jgi:hypothetical protein
MFLVGNKHCLFRIGRFKTEIEKTFMHIIFTHTKRSKRKINIT